MHSQLNSVKSHEVSAIYLKNTSKTVIICHFKTMRLIYYELTDSVLFLDLASFDD